MLNITDGLSYYSIKTVINGKPQKIHVTIFEQGMNPNLTLLISKVSEAILPETEGNHVGEGDNMDNFLKMQPNARFVINGGFSHYRKNFYEWKHQSFNIGDPVGVVKIRHHFFEDYVDLSHFGFLVQEKKGDSWKIVPKENLTKNEKYILGCTPLLIFNSQPLEIPYQLMVPMIQGKVNPPSILGHGLQNHPRTAVGIKEKKLFFITIEGGIPGYVGCTLPELQEFGYSLKLESLLNLDGGGSSQFRLNDNKNILKNTIAHEDEYRILGHVLALFDDSLKAK
jgi:hypothetical protein